MTVKIPNVHLVKEGLRGLGPARGPQHAGPPPSWMRDTPTGKTWGSCPDVFGLEEGGAGVSWDFPSWACFPTVNC